MTRRVTNEHQQERGELLQCKWRQQVPLKHRSVFAMRANISTLVHLTLCLP
jgi:hypothetical protein